MTLPGSRALAFASRWFDPETVSSVFEPLVADWQREWREAPAPARLSVWIRGASALLLSVIAAGPRMLATPWPANTINRVVTRTILWTTVLTATLSVPFVRDFGGSPDLRSGLYLLLLLVPQAVALAFPFSTTTVVDAIRASAGPTRHERIATVKFAIAAFTLMLILVGWVFPAANQQYRLTMWRASVGANLYPGPVRGLNELSITELLRYAHGGADPGRAEAMMRNVDMRLSLSILPIVFIWMRWRALLLPRGRWYSAFPLPLSAPITYVACMFFLAFGTPLADAFYAPRWLAPSLGVAALSAGALAVDRLRNRVAAQP